MNGGYDEGYEACTCFWGRQPGSLVLRFHELMPNLSKLEVLDAGCGEGKNAAFFSQHGAHVRAVDLSSKALANASANWPDLLNVRWEQSNVLSLALPIDRYDIVVCYGLLHCLPNEISICQVVDKLKAATRHGGYHIVCTFNDRRQDLSAHPGFHPTLLSHKKYVDFYRDWSLLFLTDSDLHETHPHNKISHVHSLTRLIAKKEAE